MLSYRLFFPFFLIIAAVPLRAQIADAAPVFHHHIAEAAPRLVIERDTVAPAAPAPLTAHDRIYYGASLGLNYTNGWLVEFAPYMGYKLSRAFSMGSILQAQYVTANTIDEYGQRYSLQSFTYGGGVFARHKFGENIFAHTELDYMSYESPTYTAAGFQKFDNQNRAITVRQNLPALPIGIGYTSGDMLSFDMLLLYDLLHTRNSPTPSAWTIRMGLAYNF
jgi:hypothetical protein